MTFMGTEFAMRDYARDQVALTSLLSNDKRRIDVGRPRLSGTDFLVIFRVGGAPMRDYPFDRALLQFDCWAGTRGAAQRLQDALCGVLYSMANVPLNAETMGRDADIQSVLYSPDPGSEPGEQGTPRYVVTALVTASSRTAAAAS